MESISMQFYKNILLYWASKNELTIYMDITVAVLRGIIGMMVLIGIAYIFSANKKGINWKTVGYGLLIQLFLAIGILKGSSIGFNIGNYRLDLSFISAIFDYGGKAFTQLLDFTLDGSKFLMGDLMDVSSFGFSFAFQVLPTIIFFSALTSLLFYLGFRLRMISNWRKTSLLPY